MKIIIIFPGRISKDKRVPSTIQIRRNVIVLFRHGVDGGPGGAVVEAGAEVAVPPGVRGGVRRSLRPVGEICVVGLHGIAGLDLCRQVNQIVGRLQGIGGMSKPYSQKQKKRKDGDSSKGIILVLFAWLRYHRQYDIELIPDDFRISAEIPGGGD